MELALLRLILGRVILLLGLLLLLVVDRMLLKALVVTEVVIGRGTGPRLPRLLRCLSLDFDRAELRKAAMEVSYVFCVLAIPGELC